MSDEELRDLFEEECSTSSPGDDRVNVLVSLHARHPDAAILAHLKSAGLAIERVIGNTVLGSVLPAQMASLRRDTRVREVEPSVQLRPNQARDEAPPES